MLFVADQNKVLFKFESGTYGTESPQAGGSGGYWLGLVTDHSPTDNENVAVIRYAGQTNRNYGQLVNTMKDYEGTITYHPQDFTMFGFALGSNVDSGSPSPYAHSIREVDSDNIYAFTSGTGRNNNFASFQVVDSKKSATDGQHQVRTYKGCVVDSLIFTASQGEPVVCELNYMAQSLTIGSKTTDIPNIVDENTSRPYLWSDVIVHKPSGTVLNKVTEVAWTINNNLQRKHYDNGSKVVENLTPLNRNYEVTITMDADSTQALGLYETNFQNGTTFNMMIEANLSTGSQNGFFIMSGCKITDFESPSPAEGINEYNITIVPQNTSIDSADLTQFHNPI